MRKTRKLSRLLTGLVILLAVFVVTSCVDTYCNYVSFNSNGGSNIDRQAVLDRRCAKKPDDPTRYGYTFKGWYTDNLYKEAYNWETVVIDDFTLYAKWDKNSITVTGVSLDTSLLEIEKGLSTKLVATITPTDAANKSVAWASDNTSIATVEQDGTVKAIAPGKTTVRVTTAEGGYTASCFVTVVDSGNWDITVIDKVPSGIITYAIFNEDVCIITLTDTNEKNGKIETVDWYIDQVEQPAYEDKFECKIEPLTKKNYVVSCVIGNSTAVSTISDTITI